MTEPADRIIDLLYENLAPTQPPDETESCPSIPELDRAVTAGAGLQERAGHIRYCAVCRPRTLTIWQEEHPPLAQLVKYALSRHPLAQLLAEHVDACEGDCERRLNGAFVGFLQRLQEEGEKVADNLRTGRAAPALLGSGEVRSDLGDVTVVAAFDDNTDTVRVSAEADGRSGASTVTGHLEPGHVPFEVAVGGEVQIAVSRPPSQLRVHDIDL